MKYLGLTVSFIASAVFISGCSSSVANEEREAVAKNEGIETFALQQESFASSFQLPGELIAYQSVDLYAKVSGFVKTLNADIGLSVKTGQVLATLDAPEVSSQRNAAESRLKSQEAIFTASEANYKRLLETSRTPGTISQNDLDLAEAKTKSDYANLEAARASLREISEIGNYLVIRAPFDGVITARNVNTGAYVGPSGKGSEAPIFTLQQQSKLRLVVSVPEAYTGYLRGESVASFKVRAYPAETFTATVSRTAKALDTKLRAERIEFDIDNRDNKLLPGTIADVTIPLKGDESGFLIPRTALVNSGEGVFVVRVINGKAQRVPVKKGLDSSGKAEVFGDLKAGDVLVLKASDEIKDGTDIAQ